MVACWLFVFLLELLVAVGQGLNGKSGRMEGERPVN
jgi:hypothetical protein